MPTIQTTYVFDQGKAMAGMRLSDFGLFTHCIAEADIAYGLGVKRGTAPGEQAVVGGGSGFMGIALHTVAQEAAYSDATIKIEAKETFEIMRMGMAWVSPANDVVAGDGLVVVNATGALKGGTAGAGETQIIGSNWETSASANGLAVLNLNIARVIPYITATAVQTAKSFTHGVAITAFSPLTPVSGGQAPYIYYVSSGTLDAGLSLDQFTGIVSGNPTSAAAAHNVTFSVKDGNGAVCATSSTVSITVA